MADETQGTQSATFDDYVTGGGQITTETTPAEPPTAPSGNAPTPAPERPRDASGKFVSTKAELGNASVAPVEESVPAAQSTPDQEAAARALGWKPLDEFGGDPRKWVEARVWVENTPLVHQIKSYKQQLRERNKALEAAQQHYSRVHQAAYERAIADLSEQKRGAIVAQDIDKVDEIDRSISEVEANFRKQPPQTPTFDPAYTDWIDSNPTIVGDPALKAFAISYEQALIASEPNLDIEGRLDKTTQAVRAAFPDRFKNTRRQAPALVEGTAASSNGAATKKFSVSDLSADERTVMNRLVSSGVLTEAQYLKDIQEARNGTYTLDI